MRSQFTCVTLKGFMQENETVFGRSVAQREHVSGYKHAKKGGHFMIVPLIFLYWLLITPLSMIPLE